MNIKRVSVILVLAGVVICILLMTPGVGFAAPIDNVPVTVTQPDGTVLNIFASGDEYYNWLHDADGFTIIQHPETGYYVYADVVNGNIVATDYVVGAVNPTSVGLSPYLNVTPEKMGQIRESFLSQPENQAGLISSAPHSGTITNLVVFIRFSGESEFTDSTTTYTDMLNSTTSGANSLKNYYKEVSYNALIVNSNLYPTPGSTVVSYQDSHARGYFQPYNASTNPDGYIGGDLGTERRVREHTLLKDAVNYVVGLGQFPSGSTIDSDNDGKVDSITFIVRGSPTGWNSLLWPHKWNLYTYTVKINNKTIDEYAFQLQSTVDTGVLAHEMFHVLGAPDLYHYTSNGIQPVGSWDVMENDLNPPQHMGCFMKYKYGDWISSIPVLSGSGTQAVSPLGSSSTNNCFRINSPNTSKEYFIVEYRRESDSNFENSLPGTGLLVYRINTSAGDGNADGPPDEVYIYRPGGTTTANGSVNTANFSSGVGRTAINDSTDPSSFLTNGSAGGLNIRDIGSAGSSISFTYGIAGITPTLISPSGAYENTEPRFFPTFTWSTVSGAKLYSLEVYQDGVTKPVYRKSIKASSTECGASTCSHVMTKKGLGEGSYQWRVRALVGKEWTDWSPNLGFSYDRNGFDFDFTSKNDLKEWKKVFGGWKIANGYQYAKGVKDYYVSTYFDSFQYTKLNYRASMKRYGCDTCANAIIVRGQPFPTWNNEFWKKHWATGYYFAYTNNGGFSIWRFDGTSETYLKDWTSSTAIVQGGWNTLKATAVGSTLNFYINGTLVFTTTDTNYSSGYVGTLFWSDDSVGNELYVDYARLSETDMAASSLLGGEQVDGDQEEFLGEGPSTSAECIPLELSSPEESEPVDQLPVEEDEPADVLVPTDTPEPEGVEEEPVPTDTPELEALDLLLPEVTETPLPE